MFPVISDLAVSHWLDETGERRLLEVPRTAGNTTRALSGMRGMQHLQFGGLLDSSWHAELVVNILANTHNSVTIMVRVLCKSCEQILNADSASLIRLSTRMSVPCMTSYR